MHQGTIFHWRRWLPWRMSSEYPAVKASKTSHLIGWSLHISALRDKCRRAFIDSTSFCLCSRSWGERELATFRKLKKYFSMTIRQNVDEIAWLWLLPASPTNNPSYPTDLSLNQVIRLIKWSWICTGSKPNNAVEHRKPREIHEDTRKAAPKPHNNHTV